MRGSTMGGLQGDTGLYSVKEGFVSAALGEDDDAEYWYTLLLVPNDWF